MRKIFHADRVALDRYNNLVTVTATAFEGSARVTGQLNGKTVREEKLFAVADQTRLDSCADNMVELLQRSASPIKTSELERCEISGRVK